MRIGPVLAAMVLGAAVPVHAQAKPPAPAVAFPAGERGQLARQWLDAYRSGDPAVYRKYMEAYAETGATPIDARVERYHDMRENLGDLTVLEVKESPEGIELKVRTAKGEEGTLTVMITAKAPFKLQAIRVEI